jgi:hypothetical protein
MKKSDFNFGPLGKGRIIFLNGEVIATPSICKARRDDELRRSGERRRPARGGVSIFPWP